MSFTKLVMSSYQDDSAGLLTRSVIGSIDNMKEFRLNSYFIKGDKVFFDNTYFDTTVGFQVKGTYIKICKTTHFTESFIKENWQDFSESSDSFLENKIEYSHNDMKLYPGIDINIYEQSGYSIPMGRTLKLNPDTNVDLINFYRDTISSMLNSSNPYADTHMLRSTHFNGSFYDGIKRGLLSIEYYGDEGSRKSRNFTTIQLSGDYIIELDPSIDPSSIVLGTKKLLNKTITSMTGTITDNKIHISLNEDFLYIEPAIDNNDDMNLKMKIYQKDKPFISSYNNDNIYHMYNIITPNGISTIYVNDEDIIIEPISNESKIFTKTRTEDGYDYFTSDMYQDINVKVPNINIIAENKEVIFITNYIHNRNPMLPIDSSEYIVYIEDNGRLTLITTADSSIDSVTLDISLLDDTYNTIPLGYRPINKESKSTDSRIPNNYPSIVEIRNRNFIDKLIPVYNTSGLDGLSMISNPGINGNDSIEPTYTWTYNDALYFFIKPDIYIYDLKSQQWLMKESATSRSYGSEISEIHLSKKSRRVPRDNGLVYFLRHSLGLLTIYTFDCNTNEYGPGRIGISLNSPTALTKNNIEEVSFFGDIMYGVLDNYIISIDMASSDNQTFIELPSEIHSIDVSARTKYSMYVDYDEKDDNGNPIPKRIFYSVYLPGLTNNKMLMAYYDLETKVWMDINTNNPNNEYFEIDFGYNDGIFKTLILNPFDSDGNNYGKVKQKLMVSHNYFSGAILSSTKMTISSPYSYSFINHNPKPTDILNYISFFSFSNLNSIMGFKTEGSNYTIAKYPVISIETDIEETDYVRNGLISIDSDTMRLMKEKELNKKIAEASPSTIDASIIEGKLSMDNIPTTITNKIKRKIIIGNEASGHTMEDADIIISSSDNMISVLQPLIYDDSIDEIYFLSGDYYFRLSDVSLDINSTKIIRGENRSLTRFICLRDVDSSAYPSYIFILNTKSVSNVVEFINLSLIFDNVNFSIHGFYFPDITPTNELLIKFSNIDITTNYTTTFISATRNEDIIEKYSVIFSNSYIGSDVKLSYVNNEIIPMTFFNSVLDIPAIGKIYDSIINLTDEDYYIRSLNSAYSLISNSVINTSGRLTLYSNGTIIGCQVNGLATNLTVNSNAIFTNNILIESTPSSITIDDSAVSLNNLPKSINKEKEVITEVFHVGVTPPTNLKLFWIDTSSGSRVLRINQSGTWNIVVGGFAP